MGTGKKTITRTKAIVIEVCDYFDYSKSELVAREKDYRRTCARMVAIYLLYTYDRQTFTSIGQMFNRDHATIMNAYYRIKSDLENFHEVGTIKSRLEKKGLL
jgi:chromosomal replication initiator protein